jgi:alkylation response protein AidB-like acyl-CoA dehydrogenase
MHLTIEQEDLRAAVRGLVDGFRLGPEPDYDAERELWRRLCTEIGIAGLAIPERHGGAGGGPVDVHVVMEELGRSLTPSPMLGSAVLATCAVLESRDEDACQRLLPGLAGGSTVAALAWTTAAGRWDPGELACAATPSGDNWLVTGDARYVLDGDHASVLLVPAVLADGETGLFEVAPAQKAVARSQETAMDGTRRLASVRFDRADARRIGGPGGAERTGLDRTGQAQTGLAQTGLARVRDLACIALSAEQAGAAAGALAATAAYAKVRVQFGRTIGSFQALQHRMAEMHVLAESARSLSYAAAAAAEQDAPDLSLRAAAAKAYCSEALKQVSAEMIQLHGAIGMTWEHPAHRYFKRAHGSALLLGTPASHVERIASAVVDS